MAIPQATTENLDIGYLNTSLYSGVQFRVYFGGKKSLLNCTFQSNVCKAKFRETEPRCDPGLAVPGEDDEGGGGTQGSDGRRGVQGVPKVPGGRHLDVWLGMLSTVVTAQYCPYSKP